MRRWTLDEARSAVLRAHGLIDRFSDPVEAVRAAVVVQTQYTVSLAPAIFARSAGATEAGIDALLRREKRLVKSWAHRSTVHTFAREDFGLVRGAIGPEFYRRFVYSVSRSSWGETCTYEEVSEQIMQALEAGPLDRRELHDRVPALKTMAWAGWGMDVKGLAYLGDVVFAEQGASRTRFARTDKWLDEEVSHPEDAKTALLRRYLAGYGPTTALDFRTWTGLSAVSCKAAWEGVRDEVEEIEIEGRPGRFFVLRGTAVDTEVGGPRLLAKFDPLLMGWKDRFLFLEGRHFSQVVRPAGQIEATLLVAGKIGGVWRLRRKGDRAEIVIDLFTPLKARAAKAVEREAEALGAALGYKRTDVIEEAV